MAETANLIEGIFWCIVGVCFAISLLNGGQRRAKLIATVNFVAFGISDFVEMRTGAWWEPRWLLAWKAACIVVMARQLLLHIRQQKELKRERATDRQP